MTLTSYSLRIVCAAAVVLTVAAPALAQAQAKQPPKAGEKPAAEAPVTAPPAKKVDLPVPPPNFEYSPQGRRDPFLSLVNRGDDSTSKGEATAKRAEGVPGMLTGELKVRGIVLTRGSYVAMISGADNKVYTVRAGEKLADGVIRTITANMVVILQEVNDPLSLEKQREVRKLLRGGDEVK